MFSPFEARNALLLFYSLVAAFGGLMLAFPETKGAGLVILGGVVSMGAAALAEQLKRSSQAYDVARAVHTELANRVARCCFDFKSPWSRIYKNHSIAGMDAERLRKFSPDSPVIYPATAAQIGLLPNNAPQALVEFYARLVALQRAIDEAARDLTHVPAVAGRMRQTLQPGLMALTALGAVIQDAGATEDTALANLSGALGLGRADQSLRSTIETLLRDNPPRT